MRGPRSVLAALTLAGVVVPAPALAGAPPLDQPTPVAGEVVLRGELRSSLDGSRFDALTQWDNFPPLAGAVAPRTGGLFDPAAGGLRVIEQDPTRHIYRLAPDSSEGPACRAAGVTSPCLVPRLQLLALERLVTAAEFGATLAGTLDAEVAPVPAPPAGRAGEMRALGWGLGAGLLAALWLGLGAVRARRGTAIGQVRLAAARARRAMRGDPTLAPARDQIQVLVARAEQLELARRACAGRLARLDPRALAARRAALTSSAAPDAAAALAMLAAEDVQQTELSRDLASAEVGLERIASALRALTLRTRSDRGIRAVAPDGDPVQALLGELDLRDRALQETGGDRP